jgi:polyhydroxyalkanoate synthesis regulator phasin
MAAQSKIKWGKQQRQERMIMSERTKLLKKAVLTSVGASGSVDRIKAALNDAMSDLVKVGTDLLDELEAKGKTKADTVEDFLKNFKEEAKTRTTDIEKQVSSKVGVQLKKVAKEVGLATREEVEELLERIAELEEAVGVTNGAEGEEHTGTKRGRRKKGADHG